MCQSKLSAYPSSLPFLVDLGRQAQARHEAACDSGDHAAAYAARRDIQGLMQAARVMGELPEFVHRVIEAP